MGLRGTAGQLVLLVKEYLIEVLLQHFVEGISLLLQILLQVFKKILLLTAGYKYNSNADFKLWQRGTAEHPS